MYCNEERECDERKKGKESNTSFFIIIQKKKKERKKTRIRDIRNEKGSRDTVSRGKLE